MQSDKLFGFGINMWLGVAAACTMTIASSWTITMGGSPTLTTIVALVIAVVMTTLATLRSRNDWWIAPLVVSIFGGAYLAVVNFALMSDGDATKTGKFIESPLNVGICVTVAISWIAAFIAAAPMVKHDR